MAKAKMPVFVYVVADERAMDPDQFWRAIIYAHAESLEEARDMREEAGCGVIVKCQLIAPGRVEWEQYVA